jgi:hypothetical protein
LAVSFKITADIQIPSAQAEGTHVANGGETEIDGFELYLFNGKPIFAHNLLGLGGVNRADCHPSFRSLPPHPRQLCLRPRLREPFRWLKSGAPEGRET